MGTNISADWTELGERMRKHIHTMETLSIVRNSAEHDEKIAGMRDGLAYYEEMGQLARVAPASAWLNLQDKLDVEGGPLIKGETVDAYRQGIRNARHAMTGFGR